MNLFRRKTASAANNNANANPPAGRRTEAASAPPTATGQDEDPTAARVRDDLGQVSRRRSTPKPTVNTAAASDCAAQEWAEQQQPTNLEQQASQDQQIQEQVQGWRARAKRKAAQFAAAHASWRPLIRPTDQAFIDKEREIGRMLAAPRSSVDDIIRSLFTSHEQRLLVPADPRKEPDLHTMQENNRTRYDALMRRPDPEMPGDMGGRFASRSNSLRLKLTMLWFGLPVAPMAMDVRRGRAEMWALYPDEAPSESEGSDEEIDAEGPLRFLNAYEGRSWGRDVQRSRSRELEAYYAFTEFRPTRQAESPRVARSIASLHGRRDLDEYISKDCDETGGDYDDDDNDDDDDDLGEDDAEDEYDDYEIGHPMDWSEPVGVALSHHIKPIIVQAMNMCGGSGRPVDKPLYRHLYAYQGRREYDINSFDSFKDTVNRLLGLKRHNGAHVVFMWQEGTSAKSGNVTLGTSVEAEAFEHSRTFFKEEDEVQGSRQVFVHVRGQRSPPKDSAFGPSAEQRSVTFTLQGSERDNCAWLHVPEAGLLARDMNVYGPWMRNVCRILAPTPDQEGPGQSVIPHAAVTLSASDLAGYDGLLEWTSYGGALFPPALWNDIVSRVAHGERNIELKMENLESSAWAVYVPGSWRDSAGTAGAPYLLHPDEGIETAAEQVRCLVNGGMIPRDRTTTKNMDVWMHGADVLARAARDAEAKLAAPLQFPLNLNTGDSDTLQEYLTSFYEQWRADPSVHPVCIVARPAIETVYVYCVPEDKHLKGVLREDINTLTVAQFRDKVMTQLGIPGGPRIRICQDERYILSEAEKQQNLSWDSATRGKYERVKASERAPRLQFLVRPDTTELEWRWMCNLLISSEIRIEALMDEAADGTADRNLYPYGCRDCYEESDIGGEESQQGPQRTAGRPSANKLARDVGTHSSSSAQRSRNPQDSTRPQTHTAGTAAAASVMNHPVPVPATAANPATKVKLPGERVLDGVKADDDVRLPRTTIYDISQTAPNKYARANAQRPLSDLEKASMARESSYRLPLSIFGAEGNAAPQIPINAPPVEALVRHKGGSVPSFTMGVMTPSEQRRMQRDYFFLRGMLLGRTQRCPWPDCGLYFPAGGDGRLREHIERAHAASTPCPLCEEPLFKHWSAEQKRKHFVVAHAELVLDPDGASQAGRATIRSEGRCPAEEQRYDFCPRCGRNHALLNILNDRTHHDNMCYPGGLHGKFDLKWCTDCGQTMRADAAGAHHGCGPAKPSEAKRPPYCSKCGVPMGGFSAHYRKKHELFCRGLDNRDAAFCPWCAVELDGQHLGHADRCKARPEAPEYHEARTNGHARDRRRGMAAAAAAALGGGGTAARSGARDWDDGAKDGEYYDELAKQRQKNANILRQHQQAVRELNELKAKMESMALDKARLARQLNEATKDATSGDAQGQDMGGAGGVPTVGFAHKSRKLTAAPSSSWSLISPAMTTTLSAKSAGTEAKPGPPSKKRSRAPTPGSRANGNGLVPVDEEDEDSFVVVGDAGGEASLSRKKRRKTSSTGSTRDPTYQPAKEELAAAALEDDEEMGDLSDEDRAVVAGGDKGKAKMVMGTAAEGSSAKGGKASAPTAPKKATKEAVGDEADQIARGEDKFEGDYVSDEGDEEGGGSGGATGTAAATKGKKRKAGRVEDPTYRPSKQELENNDDEDDGEDDDDEDDPVGKKEARPPRLGSRQIREVYRVKAGKER